MKRVCLILAGGAALLAIGGGVWWYFATRGRGYTSPSIVTVSSTALKESVVVESLGTPLPEGKTAVWCGAFDLAWKEAEVRLFKKPVSVPGAEEIVRRLNATPITDADAATGSLFMFAGRSEDAASAIRAGVRAIDARATPPTLDPSPGQFVAYAFLSANVRFALPYFENDEPLEFGNADGTKAQVRSFGIRKKDDSAYDDLRRQIRVLYCVHDEHHRKLEEFALDLCKTSQPYEIILAFIPWQATLAEGLAYVERQTSKLHEEREGLGVNDVVLVPEQAWEIEHAFSELEGRTATAGSVSMPIVAARQRIRFILDRSGAELRAEANVHWRSIPELFIFDRPHLLFMKKRGAKSPIFAMWVANAELLHAWGR